MNTYISILRGINVSGHKKIIMSELKALYESLDLKEVITYIQSGNVIFKSQGKATQESLSRKIEQAISDTWHFEVPVILRKADEIEHILDTNPFLKYKGIDSKNLYVTLLSEVPAKPVLEAIKTYNYEPDAFMIEGKDVYLNCPGGYGNTKLSNAFFESKLKVNATTRNWKTLQKLVELAS